MPLEEIEKNHILRVLAYLQGNKTKAAQTLGVTIKTLYNKLHGTGMLPQHAAQADQNSDSSGDLQSQDENR